VLARRGADDLGHLRFQHLLQRLLEQPFEQLVLLAQQGFN
jgi:hypothetical protein